MTEEQNETSTYEGTENSKWGKIVIAKQTGSQLLVIDEGPEFKGYKNTQQAMAAVRSHVEQELEELADDSNISSYSIIRVVKTVTPKIVQKPTLEFDES